MYLYYLVKYVDRYHSSAKRPKNQGNQDATCGSPNHATISHATIILWLHDHDYDSDWEHDLQQFSSHTEEFAINIATQLHHRHSSFSQTRRIGNNDNTGIKGFATWKKIQQKNVTLVSIEPGTSTVPPLWDIKSHATWDILKLSCSCTTSILDIYHSVRASRAWPYKDLRSPK